MPKIHFLCMLLMCTLASCAPTTIISPTVTIVVSPSTQVLSTLTTKRLPTILDPSTTSDLQNLTPQSIATTPPVTTNTPTQTAEPFIMSKLTSPDGKYIAYSKFYYGTEEQAIEIIDKDGNLLWKIPYQGELPHYDPRPTIGSYRWSNDSSILYFCYYWSPDGGDIYVHYSCSNLQTIEINTGNIQPVLLERVNDFAISPDGSQIAYLNCQDESCIVHAQNLSTGSNKSTSVIPESNIVAIGGLEWSPNGSGLVLHSQDQDYMLQTFYINLSTMKYKVVKKNPTPDFPNGGAFVRWVDENTLEFYEILNTSGQIVYVNVKNNEIIVIGTPTPRN